MKRIDEKVAISGDGAELIQSYLNELNMKLLAAGITELIPSLWKPRHCLFQK